MKQFHRVCIASHAFVRIRSSGKTTVPMELFSLRRHSVAKHNTSDQIHASRYRNTNSIFPAGYHAAFALRNPVRFLRTCAGPAGIHADIDRPAGAGTDQRSRFEKTLGDISRCGKNAGQRAADTDAGLWLRPADVRTGIATGE
jgi:hypothetical protein